MKAKFKSIFISLLIFLTIILFSHFISKSIGNYDEEDFKRAYVSSFIVLYIPVVISICIFKESKKWKFYLISPLFSFLITYLSVFIYFKQMKIRDSYSFYELTTFMNSLMAFFTSLLVNFIFIIKTKINNNNNRKIVSKKINYTLRIILLIPFFATTIYSTLVIIGSSSFINALQIWSNFLPLGIVLTFFSINFFNYLHLANSVNNIPFKIVSYYFFGILIFVLLSNIPYYINRPNINFDERFYRDFVMSIVLFGPYYLFIISVVHIYFLKLVSKAQKEELTKQTIESQLSYQQLKNQLSPHFLFNNINVLTSLIEENPLKAIRFSENLSDIYRFFLEQEKQDVVLVKDEIKFAKSYLKLLKDRFEVGFNFYINIEESINNKYVVSTVLQQVLENVIKHNTINEMNIVNVKITSNENYLIIKNKKKPKLKTVSDSKRGIKNIIKRIEFFTNKKVVIEDAESHFIIKLPILETV